MFVPGFLALFAMFGGMHGKDYYCYYYYRTSELQCRTPLAIKSNIICSGQKKN